MWTIVGFRWQVCALSIEKNNDNDDDDVSASY